MTSGSARILMTPAGLIVDNHEVGADVLIVHAPGAGASGRCPGCRSVSAPAHSRSLRTPRDVPAFGLGLIIRLVTRRFRCPLPSCDRNIFAEQFGCEVVATDARRTSRLDRSVHGIGVALGGRPGERLAARLSIPSAPTPCFARPGAVHPRLSMREVRRARRLRLAAGSHLWDDRLRSRTTPDHRSARRPRDRDRNGVAEGTSRDRDRLPRPGRRLS